MSTKRLLFLQDDPLLGSIYRDKLELAGFAVETARDSESGLRMLGEMRPDVIVLDALLPASDVGNSIRAIRSQSVGPEVPIYVLPTLHASLAQAAHHAGVTRLLEHVDNPISELLQVASTSLGMGGADAHKRQAPGLDERWQEATLSAAPGSLAAVRQALHDLIREPGCRVALRSLLQRVHGFAGQMALLGPNSVARLAGALEVLVFGLDETPERMTPLTMRTMGQAVDFLGHMLDHHAYRKNASTDPSHIFIIEDEASAREMIVAAMNLVGLEADGMDNPASSLAVLSSQACDLIFLDVNLPDMNGFEVCTKIRALPLHEKTPIIFLTGMNSFQNRVQSSLSGGNDFVGKPFNLAELGVKALICVLKQQLALN